MHTPGGWGGGWTLSILKNFYNPMDPPEQNLQKCHEPSPVFSTCVHLYIYAIHLYSLSTKNNTSINWKFKKLVGTLSIYFTLFFGDFGLRVIK